MNRTSLSVVALAVGAVLIIGLFNIYKPATHHLVNDVFQKVHIGRMSGDKYGLTPSEFNSTVVEIWPSNEQITQDRVTQNDKTYFAVQDNYGKKHLNDPVNRDYLTKQTKQNTNGQYTHIDWAHPHFYSYFNYVNGKNSVVLRALIFHAYK